MIVQDEISEPFLNYLDARLNLTHLAKKRRDGKNTLTFTVDRTVP